jgi:hypothetical protein
MRYKALMLSLGLSLLTALTVGCNDENANQVTGFIPRPSANQKPAVDPNGGSGVGTDPLIPGDPPPARPAPVSDDQPPLAGAQPIVIIGDLPTVPVPKPIGAGPTGVLVCTTEGFVNAIGLSLGVVGIDGLASVDQVIVNNLTRKIPLTATAVGNTSAFQQGTFVGDFPDLADFNANASPDTKTLSVAFPVEFSSESIFDFADGDILVASIRVTDINGRTAVIEAPPCVVDVDTNNLPPPPGLPIENLSLTADTFVLTQTSDTGVVGFGPISGPGALSDDFDGPGSSAFPDNGIVGAVCGASVYVTGGVGRGNRPVLLVSEREGAIVNVNEGILNPDTTQGVATPNSITLSGQRILITQSANGFLTGRFSPANFDEVYRLNYFESRQLVFVTGVCDSSSIPPTVSFEESTVLQAKVLSSVDRLFTLRGTPGGQEEPNEGVLIGAKVSSDAPSNLTNNNNVFVQNLISVSNPRFSGVFNLLDVSSNQIRTDITLIFDQVAGELTQGAKLELPLDDGSENPASGSPPFITGSQQKVGQECPNSKEFVCGRFQFNQPFAPTAGPTGEGNNPDVLVISGTFVGRIPPGSVVP